MSKRPLEMPQFKTESEEADWWASPAGRSYVKRKSAGGRQGKTASPGSSLIATLNKKTSVQIAIRLPEAVLVQARKIAEVKGIGYQTLLKIYVREGLMRESPRRKSPR